MGVNDVHRLEWDLFCGFCKVKSIFQQVTINKLFFATNHIKSMFSFFLATLHLETKGENETS